MVTPHKSFSLRSTPDGAHFEVREADSPELVREGTTPLPLFLARGSGFIGPAQYTIALSKDGYEPRSVELPTRVSGWYWMNLPFFPLGGLFGLVIDPLDGAMWEIEAPPPIELRPIAPE